MSVDICKDTKYLIIKFGNTIVRYPIDERFMIIDNLKNPKCIDPDVIYNRLPFQEEYCFFLYNNVTEFGFIKEGSDYFAKYESKLSKSTSAMIPISEKELIEIYGQLTEKLYYYSVITELTKYIPMCYSSSLIFDCTSELYKFSDDVVQDHIR